MDAAFFVTLVTTIASIAFSCILTEWDNLNLDKAMKNIFVFIVGGVALAERTIGSSRKSSY